MQPLPGKIRLPRIGDTKQMLIDEKKNVRSLKEKPTTMSLISIKELIALDEQLRKSSQPPLYDLKDTNKYQGVEFAKNHFTLQHTNLRKQTFDVDMERAKLRFKQMSAQLFDPLPEDVRKHVAVCGGSLFRMLRCDESVQRNEAKLPDIDVFLFGIPNKDQAANILQQLVAIWCPLAVGAEVAEDAVFRSTNALTIKLPYKFGNHNIKFGSIQIILRLYSSINQIIYGFDLQCAALCMTSTTEGSYQVVGSELAMFSLATDHLPVDTGRRSASFPIRLGKYMSYGVGMIFPYLDVMKAAEQFANCGFISGEKWKPNLYFGKTTPQYMGQRKATIKLQDTALILVTRTGNYSFQGYIGINKNGLQRTVSDYDEKLDAKQIRVRQQEYLNLEMIVKDTEFQPNLFLPLKSYKRINQVIDVKTYFRKMKKLMNLPQNIKQFNEQTIRFPHKFSLNFREISPEAQWTSSFNPIDESPSTWYQEYFTDQLVDENQIVTFMFSPSKLDKDAYAQSRPSLRQNILSADSNTIATLLTQDNVEFDELYYISTWTGNWKQSNVVVHMLSDIIAMNSMRDSGSLSNEDMRVIGEFFISIPDMTHEKMLDAIDIFEWSEVTRRNLGLFIDPIKRTTFINNTLPFAKIIHRILKSRRGLAKKTGISRHNFIWQEFCSNTTDVPIEELQKQASYFDINTKGKSKRELCKEFVAKTDAIIQKWHGDIKCGNSDELDLEMSSAIKDLPRELVWSREYNGQRFCYKLADMYRSVINGVKRDPRGVEISKMEKAEIISRSEFLDKVLTPYGRNLQSLASRATDAADTERMETDEMSEKGLATFIFSNVPYFPLTPLILTSMQVEDLSRVVMIFNQLIHRNRRPAETVRDILMFFKTRIMRSPVDATAVRTAFDLFIEEEPAKTEALRNLNAVRT